MCPVRQCKLGANGAEIEVNINIFYLEILTRSNEMSQDARIDHLTYHIQNVP